MSTEDILEEAINVLQQLGLKEYEARCFVGLSRLPSGTAKQLSEITDVPRTRVYDAIRVLETQGLVEVQHSSPQRFRAVSIEEATKTLRGQYEKRIDQLSDTLEKVEQAQPQGDEAVQEVWSLSGFEAIDNRTQQLIEDGTDEVVLVIGHESLLTEALINRLNDLHDETDLCLGAVHDSLQERLRDTVSHTTTFLSGLKWLHTGTEPDVVTIGRLLLVDRSNIVVSTINPATRDEHAIFARGFRNGFVVIARRLMTQGIGKSADLQA